MVGKKSLISGKIVYFISYFKLRVVDEMGVFCYFLWCFAPFTLTLQTII